MTSACCVRFVSYTTELCPTACRTINNKGKFCWERAGVESNALLVAPMVLVIKIGQYHYVRKRVQAQRMVVLPVNGAHTQGEWAQMGLVEQRFHQMFSAPDFIRARGRGRGWQFCTAAVVRNIATLRRPTDICWRKDAISPNFTQDVIPENHNFLRIEAYAARV